MTMVAKLKIAAAVVLGVVVLTCTLFQVSKSRNFQFFGNIVNRIETSEKVVALTFDDGPTPGATQRIIDILARENIKATFFLTGREIESHPQEARLLFEAGHSLGNHSYSHKRMVFMSYGDIAAEIEMTSRRIRDLGYTSPLYFRPPYGKKLIGLPVYLQQHSITTITWDLEPDTYPEIAASSDAISHYVVNNTKPGSIILLHVMYPSRSSSMDAVPGIIRGLKDKGFRFVTIDELLPLQL